MRLIHNVKNLLSGFFKSDKSDEFDESGKSGQSEESDNQDWWVKITTTQPRCTYYFGPFDSSDEAKTAQPGYVEDLQNEGAGSIDVLVQRCNPQVLTVCDEEF